MRKLCLLILSLEVAFCALITLAHSLVYASPTDDSNPFCLSIDCANSNLDLSSLEIKIYTSVLSYKEVENDYAYYDGIYTCSVYPDACGVAIFSRPSDCFTIEVNLDTLPIGYGIDSCTWFFMPNMNEHHIALCEISTVDITNENGEIRPIIQAANGLPLLANASVTDETSILNLSVDSENHQISYTKNYVVDVQGTLYTLSDNVILNYSSDYQKAGILYENGIITRFEYVNLLSFYILNPQKVYSDTDFPVDGTELYWNLRNYLDSPESAQEDLSQIIAAMKKMDPRYEVHSTENTKSATFIESKSQNDTFTNSVCGTSKSLSFVISSSGHFRINYDASETSSSVAYAVASVFEGVDTLFYTTWGFNRPYYTPIATYYDVYLVGSVGYAAQTIRHESEGSYIKVSLPTANAIASGTLSNYGVIAHEYMHAIFFRYGIPYGTSDEIWMHECFATWAGLAYIINYANYIYYRVNQFTSAPYKPLTQHSSTPGEENRASGSCVFPLYIQQQQGGVDTIKKILINYSISNHQPLFAINSGLAYYGYN